MYLKPNLLVRFGPEEIDAPKTLTDPSPPEPIVSEIESPFMDEIKSSVNRQLQETPKKKIRVPDF
jgi:hypothetical protein